MSFKVPVRTMMRTIWLALLVVVIGLPGPARAAEPVVRILVWDTKALFADPKVRKIEECPAKGLRSFFYEGAEYKGKPTWVFGYYAAPEGKSPTFLVAAVKDPRSGNLDRAQVIKVWVDADGERHERIHDVAWGGDRQPDASGKLPPVGKS